MTKAQVIRQALTRHGQLIMPGVYDALSAKIAARAGFEVMFITGYSLSATLLGEPDFGLLTQTEVVGAAQRICSVIDIPVSVDADHFHSPTREAREFTDGDRDRIGLLAGRRAGR